MSNASHIGAANSPSRRTRRVAWAGSIAILVGAVAAAVVVFTGGSSRPTASTVAPSSVGTPAKQSPAAPRNVRLDPAAKRVLGRFVLTAVARKNLLAAYDLAGPGIRQGMTLKQWLTGSIPVVPYEVSSLRYAPFKIDYAHPDHALVEVAMIPTSKASKGGLKSQIFFADIVRIGGKWFVNSWVPRGFPTLPSDPGHG